VNINVRSDALEGPCMHTHIFRPVVECRRWCAEGCRGRGRCGAGRSGEAATLLETHVRSTAVVMRRARDRDDACPVPSARGPTMVMSSPGREKKPRFGSAPTSTNGGLVAYKGEGGRAGGARRWSVR